MSETGASVDKILTDLAASGLFDYSFYKRQTKQDLPDADLIKHYVDEGEAADLQPSFMFRPSFYRQQNSVTGCTNLLLHYKMHGEREGFRPSLHFDPVWYADNYGIDRNQECALADYLANAGERSPNRYYDIYFYLLHSPDVRDAGIAPYEHFVSWGVFEGRKCGTEFDARHVWSKYLNNDRSINPFLAFLEYGAKLRWRGVAAGDEASVHREFRRFQAAGPEFEKSLRNSSGIRNVKAIAFYLPQFHAIPENDEWWGAGFTEWRNVPRGAPRFVGHYQPRVPRDLGFYDLSNSSIMKRQIAFAQSAGLHGFCFYYYNFSGHRLLEKPLDAFFADARINFPFCVLWANENWSRRWDGLEHEVLMKQQYRRSDEEELVDDLSRYMKDSRYIRINGRPLLPIYRSDVIPDVANVINRWRRRFRTLHQLDPLIIMAQAFGLTDPRPGGFDGAYEFPPHKYGATLSRITHSVTTLDPDFEGQVYSYDDLVEASLKDYPTEYPLIKTILPSWDNDARKQGSGLCLHGSSPAKFQSWMERLVAKAKNDTFHGERLVFINAWNEWCEGTYLEPDVHFGFAYLNALSRALDAHGDVAKRKVLLVGHDAFPAGAQMLLYNIGRTLHKALGIEISFVLMDGGALVPLYHALAPTFVVDVNTDYWPALRTEVERLRSAGFALAITNSAFSGHCVGFLADSGFKVCSLIHELKTIITRYYGTDRYKMIAARSKEVVFPNNYVKNEVIASFGSPLGKSLVIPQGLYKEIDEDPSARDSIRQLLHLPQSARIVLNTGYADLRKGVDLFVALAREVARLTNDVHFVWVGNVDPAIDAWIVEDIRKGRVRNAHFVAFTDDISKVLNGADMFFLSSREDPFPSVVLEAVAVGLQVGAFDTGGGYVDFIRDNPFVGFLAPSGDLAAAAEAIVNALDDEFANGPARKPARKALINERHDFKNYCFSLLKVLQPTLSVSVVVPNYNYKPYLRDRLQSVFNQTYPIYEIIVLDDCSTDDSLDELEHLGSTMGRDFVLIENEKNSGNVFAQWRRGVEEAKGDIVWIAEADDLADPGFLEHLVPMLATGEVGMAFSDSRTIDEFGVAQWDSYKGYYNTLFPGALSENGVFEGNLFLRDYLSVKNVIMNVSSVLWRKNVLARALDGCAQDLAHLKMAGDWRVYAEVCLQGQRIGYEAAALNVHRRHSTSVTHALKKETHRNEIAAMHELVRRRLGPSALADRQAEYLREISVQFGLVPAVQ